MSEETNTDVVAEIRDSIQDLVTEIRQLRLAVEDFNKAAICGQAEDSDGHIQVAVTQETD